MSKKITYGSGIQTAFEYILENYDNSFIIGQGLWSPWYVGNTMVDLDKKFGKERIIFLELYRLKKRTKHILNVKKS